MPCNYANSDAELPRGVDDARCPASWQVIRLQQGVPRVLQVTVDDPALDSVGDYEDGDEVSASDNAAVELVRLYFADNYNDSQYRVVGGVRTGARTFQFNFNARDLDRAGLFVGEVLIYDVSSGGALDVPTDPAVPDPSAAAEDDEEYRPVYVHRVYVEVEDASLAPNDRSPLTVSGLRLWLRDNCPAGNFLLDDYEFTDREIIQAMRAVVDYWNEVPPPVTRFNPSTFPFRYHHALATTSVLMRQASRHKLRNWLPTSAAGVSVQDQSVWNEYHRLADIYWNEYTQWVRDKKVEINIQGGYRASPGRFAGPPPWRATGAE